MSWNQEQVKMLIELYKLHPCLYAVKNKDYKNKHARINALETICSELQCLRASTTIAEIKGKFNNIRTNFLSEHRKYVNSLKSGMGTDEIYKPNIWYYDHMKFILEHSTVRQSVDMIMSPLTSPECTKNSVESTVEEAFSYSQDDIEDYLMEDTSFINDEELRDKIQFDTSKPSTSTTGVVPKLAKKKRKLSNLNNEDETIYNATEVLKKINQSLETESSKTATTTKRTESQIFGDFITNQLSLIEEDEQIFLDTQFKIFNVLHEARQKIVLKRNKQ